MKIRINKNDTDVGSISFGENFWFGGALFMKIDSSYFPITDSVFAVCLLDGIVREFDPDTQVEKQDCMVIGITDNTMKGKWDI